MATLSAAFELTNNDESDITYHVTDDKIQGTVDGLEALRQSVLKTLSVQKYEYEIYDFDYGIDLDSLIGKERSYIEVESKRRIREALLKDSRIESIDNFSYSYEGDSVTIEFDVISIYGTTNIKKEVSI